MMQHLDRTFVQFKVYIYNNRVYVQEKRRKTHSCEKWASY